jgi:Fic family protein
MNDTIMKLNVRQIEIVNAIRFGKAERSSDFPGLLSGKASLITIKRDLAELLKRGFLTSSGKGPAVKYTVTSIGKVWTPVFNTYPSVDPDSRGTQMSYDHGFFESINFPLFSNEEEIELDTATRAYAKHACEGSEIIHKKELERFVIEMSWKSSSIEGNTYTLLDTERLLREGISAPGKTKDEAVMIINHKKAFGFIHEHRELFAGEIKHATVEEVHKLLVAGLGVAHGVRRSGVGITGSIYKPLDNAFQIREALEALYGAVKRTQSPYAKALLVLLGMSYIQGFEDGNKRTARLIANGILLAHGCAPLSYRSTDAVLYREATLIFYETLSMVTMKKIFIEQYLFSTKTYLVS